MSDETTGPIGMDSPSPSTAGASTTAAPLEAAPSMPSSWPEPTPPARRSRARAAIIGVAAVVVAIGGKIVLTLAAGAVVGSTLGAFFGGPFQRLPSDQRAQFETRLTSAVGSSFDGLSDTDKKARVVTMLKGGLPRLSDPILIERIQLFATALQKADPAVCAAVARASLLGKPDLDAADKVIGGLDPTPFGGWVEINVEAVEAENRSAPPARTVSQDASAAMYRSVFAGLTTTDTSTITSVAGGGSVSDANACAAMRDLYASGNSLSPAELSTFALLDVSQ